MLMGKVSGKIKRDQTQLLFRLGDGDYLPIPIEHDGTFRTSVPLRFGKNLLSLKLVDEGRLIKRILKDIKLIDNAPPLVNLGVDRHGVNVGDEVIVTATAVDNRKLARLAIYDNGKLIASARQSPLIVKVINEYAIVSDHVFTATASDGNLEQESQPATVQFTASRGPFDLRMVSWGVSSNENYKLRGIVESDNGVEVTASLPEAENLTFPASITESAFEVAVPLRPGWNPVIVRAKNAQGTTEVEQFNVYRAHFKGMKLADPRVIALHPLVQEILESYGLDENSPPIERATALRDWVARNMVHPDARLHPNGSQAGTSVLPPGMSWASVNGITTWDKINADQQFWATFQYDGYAMLDALLGTLDLTTGTRKQNGMMKQTGPGQFQIRNLETFKYPYCTYQVSVLQVLWAAAGFQSMALSSNGHDPAAVFIPDMGWVYSDPTFNESFYRMGDDRPLDIPSLFKIARAGDRKSIRPRVGIGVGRFGPSWDNEQYISESITYLKLVPNGWSYLRALTDNRLLGGTTNREIVTLLGSIDPMPGPVEFADSVFAPPSARTDSGQAKAEVGLKSGD